MALLSAWISSSQPLQEPASTSRIVIERPNNRRVRASSARPTSSSAISSGARRLIVTGLANRDLSNSVRILEIVPRIGAVERFVAQRKISNDVVLDRRLEQRPLKPRGIADVTARYRPVGGKAYPYQHIASEGFD